MSPPDKALPRPLGSSTSKSHTTCQHFVTLHLLESIKEVCRDHSKGEGNEKKKKNHDSNKKQDTSI
jgi:hypothetical protein